MLGLNSNRHTSKQAISDNNLLYYAGLFTQCHSSVIGLKNLLSDFFQIPIEVQQFVGSWTKLQNADCTRMPSQTQPKGQFNTLGKNTMLGNRVWSSQGKFRIILGPLSSEKFKYFLPNTIGIQQLKALVRHYIGIEFNFDIQLISEAHTVPPCHLSSKNPPQLGYFTWLTTENRTLQHDELILT